MQKNISQEREELHGILNHALEALNQGEAERGRELAHSVYSLAESRAHTAMQGRALICLAHCDLMVSRFRRSQETAQRAAALFKQLEDPSGEAEALTILARAAAFLGRNEEAVESALLSVQLTAHLEQCNLRAKAHNALGIAYYFSRSFEKAEAALEETVHIARGCSPALSAFQPRLDQAFAEAIRNAKARYLNEYLPKTDRMQNALSHCGQLLGAESVAAQINQGEEVWGRSSWHLLSGLSLCWNGDLAGAERELRAGAEWTRRYQTTTSLHAIECWLSTEIAWARNQWSQAEEDVARMVELATRVEHEQLACVGHLLASEIFEAQGKHALALEEQRRLRRRELRNRAESLDSRARMVGAQFEARRTEQTLHAERKNSQELARMALEDVLTGIANRRGFSERLADFLRRGADSENPLSLAMIDVDDFKRVNDQHSHTVGDLVLKELACIFMSQIREHDLVARIGGDEFVIVFGNADATAASQVCERIRDSVSDFDWGRYAHGLRISVSLGVIQSEPADTVESLLHRSDMAMYGSKRHRAET